MPFIKPPFFQPGVRPVAARGLGEIVNPPQFEFNVIGNGFDNNHQRAASGWYDLTIPAGYVPGSGITIRANAVYTGLGTFPFNAIGIQADGGAFTNLGHAAEVPDSATVAIGSHIVPFCPVLESTIIPPHPRQTVSWPINGSNRNSYQWPILNGIIDPNVPLDGGTIVFDSTPYVPAYPPGAGLTQPVTGPPGAEVRQADFQILWYALGGTGLSGGIAENTIQYGPGDVISIALTLGTNIVDAQLYIYGMCADCGDGGIVQFDLNNFWVNDANIVPFGAGLPRKINSTIQQVHADYPDYQWRIFSFLLQNPENYVAPIIRQSGANNRHFSLFSVGAWLWGPTSYTYQWFANGSPVPGAHGIIWDAPPAYDGQVIFCRVTGHNNVGTGTGDSNALVSGPITVDLRITEAGDLRVTEAGDFRVTL